MPPPARAREASICSSSVPITGTARVPQPAGADRDLRLRGWPPRAVARVPVSAAALAGAAATMVPGRVGLGGGERAPPRASAAADSELHAATEAPRPTPGRGPAGERQPLVAAAAAANRSRSPWRSQAESEGAGGPGPGDSAHRDWQTRPAEATVRPRRRRASSWPGLAAVTSPQAAGITPAPGRRLSGVDSDPRPVQVQITEVHRDCRAP